VKWNEVQVAVCSSRRNFAHVPLSRSLQPGKGRMAGKSRTVEVRFYKESRVLVAWGEEGSRCLLNICISRCRWKNIHRCTYETAWKGEMVSFTLWTSSFLLFAFVLQRVLFYPSFFFSLFLPRFLRLVSLSLSS